MQGGEDKVQAKQELAFENAKRIQYISAAAATLRVRTDFLVNNFGSAESSYEAAQATIEKIQALIAEIRPTAEIANEFRKKWDRQKQTLIDQRETEIEKYLQKESEAMAVRAEGACEAELESTKSEVHAEAEWGIKAINDGHMDTLRKAVKHWYEQVHGADQVRAATIDELLKGAITRLTAWTSEEERYLMQRWEEELNKNIVEVHRIDSEAFAAMDNMHKARCSVMEDTIQRQQKELLNFRNEYQAQLAEVADQTLQLPQDGSENYFKNNTTGGDRNKSMKMRRPVYTPPPPSTTPKALNKLMHRRIAVAKAEASAASEAHARSAVDQLASFAMKEQEHLLAFQMAVEKVWPQLSTHLQDELTRLSNQAEIAEAQRAKEASSEASAATQRSRAGARAKRLSKAGAAKGGGKVGSTASGRQHPNATTLRTASSGDGEPRRGSQTTLRSSPWTSPGTSPGGDHFDFDSTSPQSEDALTLDSPHIMDAQEDGIDEDEESGGSEEYDREDELNRMHRKNEIMRQQQQLASTQSAVTKGDWEKNRKDLMEVAEAGAEGLKAAESAMEAQAKVLRVPSLGDPQAINNAAARLMKHSEDYATTIRNDFVRVRNMKVALCRARAAYAREAQQQHNWEVLEFEDEVLPAISKLAHEAETAVEVGHALKRGVERIPIWVIIGAWRRGIVASFPILKHMWDGAQVEKAEREKFVSRLFDALLRAPGAAQQFESQTLSAQGGIPPALR